jgi:hypothetical protein
MNTEFFRLIGSLKAIEHFITSQYHNVEDGTHGPEKPPHRLENEPDEVRTPLKVLREVADELLHEHARISHAVFDFRRALSRNAEAFYHAINKLRRKAPEWQIMDEDLLRLIENYQDTASSLFFGGDGGGGGVVRGSSSS